MLLATSDNLRIYNEFEVAFLQRSEGSPLVIGDFYGDPQAAIIDWNEKWCAVAGHGLILYRLEEPFLAYEPGVEDRQWSEFFRDGEEDFYIEALYQIDDNIFRFVVDPYCQQAGLYELDVKSLKIKKLIPGDPNG